MPTHEDDFGPLLNRRGGFTIVELLAVMLIITLLVALVVGVARYADYAANAARAKAEMERLHAAIESYELEEGHVPDPEDFYTDAFRRRRRPALETVDPWGAPYAYTNFSDRSYALTCKGPDGELHTDDDIEPGD